MSNTRGFSLVELMVAVGIVGILTAIAYPAYTDSVRKSRRADGRAALIEVAQFMAKTYAENKTYQPGGSGTTPSFAVRSDVTPYYSITLTGIGANAFTLSAAPISTQASDKCGTLRINQLGEKTVYNATSGYTASNCW